MVRKLNFTIILLVSLFSYAQVKENTLKKRSGNEVFSSKMSQKSDSIVIGQFDFESKNDLAIWKSEKGSTELSKSHFKDGENSLLWNWTKRDFLVVEDMKGLERASRAYKGGTPEFYEPAYFPQGNYGGVKMWIYQEIAQKGTMVFQIGSDPKAAKTNPRYKFEVNLNFTGWRSVWVNFEEDAKVKNYKGNATMKSFISYPSNNSGTKGQLYIDHFILLDFVSYKRHSDMQFENKKQDIREDSYEIIEPYKEYLSNTFEGGKTDKTALEKNSKLISDRLEYLILGDKTDRWKKRNSTVENSMQSLLVASNAYYTKLGLERKGDVVNGVSLFSVRDEHAATKSDEFQNVCQATLFPLAMDYRMNNTQSSKEQLFNVFDYIKDQGFASGSALGTVDHMIKLNAVAQSMFLMRDELASQNKLKEKIDLLAWHSRIGAILNIEYTKSENSDKIRGGALVKLVTVLMMDNSPKKEAYLQLFKEYMDFVIGITPGYGDTIKSDFSIFHHRGTYLNTYGIQAVNTMAMVHWLLAETPYALSGASTEILKKTILKQSDIAFGTDLHFGVCGRFPESNSSIGPYLLPAFAFMSLEGNEIVDKTLAARYDYLYDITAPEDMLSILSPTLTYSGTFGTLDLMVRLKELTQGNASTPAAGNYTMPYSSMSVHRTKNAYATVKGYNKYVWDFETGSSTGENMLGRYLSFGTLITTQTNPKDGFIGAGIDFNGGFHTAYLPGATTKALPIEKVYYTNKGNTKYIEGYHRSYAETTFANGLSQEDNNGMYAMELRDDVGPDADKVLFDDSFRAKKSYFFIDNEIICLGSNIQNNDSRYNTITTLFQYKFNDGKPTFYKGESIGNSLSLTKNLTGGYFTDQNGIHYLLQDGSKIILEQNPQKSLKKVGAKYEKTAIPHVKAYLDHGSAPKEEEYEYQILFETPKESVAEYVNAKSYAILSKNENVHSIYHQKSKTTAYAIFSVKAELQGPLLQTDTPILAMFKENKKYSIFTIANPDLQMVSWNHNMSRMPDEVVNGVGKGSIVKVTLKGLWAPAKYIHELQSIQYIGSNTMLEIYCKEGKSIDIPLQVKN
jgi:chondroitin-sulfate-ABC endolyase/exolyase